AQQNSCGCPAPVVRQKPTPPPAMCCPAPVRQKPAPVQCCPAPVLEKPSAPEAVSCCPGDPKQVRRAERAADHAHHEAAEACRRQQRAAAKAQARIDRAAAKGDRRVARANARVEARNAQWAQANEQLANLTGGPQPEESVAEVKQPEPEIERT